MMPLACGSCRCPLPPRRCGSRCRRNRLEYRKCKRPFPPLACVPPCPPVGGRLGPAPGGSPPAQSPRRVCPRVPGAPGSHAPATLALSGRAFENAFRVVIVLGGFIFPILVESWTTLTPAPGFHCIHITPILGHISTR